MFDGSEFTILVEAEDSGKRFDAHVSDIVSGCSRSFAVELIRRGEIKIGGEKKKPGYRLKTGENISGSIPKPEPVHYGPEPVDIDILHEDDHIIVINKQPGLVVHPAPGHYSGTLVNGLLYHCPGIEGIGGKQRPGIVHRLDKDTSGIMIIAKNDSAHQHLSMQFKLREIKKRYLALVHGVIRIDEGVISLPVGRHENDRKKMSTTSRSGRPAKTLWKVRERFSEAALLDIDLMTGRTHQIRVHMAAIGHPVIGDTVYCGRAGKNVAQIAKSAQRQMLHALCLTLTHPFTGKTVQFEAPVFNDMTNIIEGFRLIPYNDFSNR